MNWHLNWKRRKCLLPLDLPVPVAWPPSPPPPTLVSSRREREREREAHCGFLILMFPNWYSLVMLVIEEEVCCLKRLRQIRRLEVGIISEKLEEAHSNLEARLRAWSFKMETFEKRGNCLSTHTSGSSKQAHTKAN